MKRNDYVKGMIEAEQKYNELCQKFEELKSEKRKSMDVDEYWEWLGTQSKPEPPFTHGAAKPLRAIYWCDLEELEVEDHVWESEVEDFVDALRKAEVATFVLTNKSTALMDNMHWFAQNGCKRVGLCEIEKTNRWGDTEKKMGVRFEL